jgi:hypothetical protein
MQVEITAASITAAATFLSAVIAAVASLLARRASRRTQEQVRQYAIEQAEHEIIFEGLYTRRLDTIARLYRLIADLRRMIQTWISSDENLARRKELLRHHPGAPKNVSERQAREHELKEREQRNNRYFLTIRQQQLKLERFNDRNSIWFTYATCEKLDELLKLQKRFMEESDPSAHSRFLSIAQEIDELNREMDNELEALDELLEMTDEKHGQDASSRDDREPKQQEKPIVEQINETRRKYRDYLIPALDATRVRVEEEFRTILGVH